ncbi:MAG TPA: phosphoglycerate kinase [Anaerolineaceae bacterium]|jgi:phosphoglycerate kinase|nr:phosphoglycerate kinase [Anaerolineaceae bacterium]NMD30692.1 phosphoglycerate kinase [Chloroflexota bacterium]HNS63427.1 phosphoglycerate kinase [Anaerolineaceae bacterium]HNZ01158.1 phosphoglycerate kinase [Anaerolineaceae bacterium]HOD43991.1 phosphoglycerate kinase [Anaerolineaceae bacterium]
MFSKKTIRDIEVKGKRVLVRVDFNVPLKDNAVGDDTRIRSALPTIQYLLDHGAAVILCSHLGRPKGGPDPKYTLKPVAAHLAGLLGKPVAFAEDCIGAPAETAVSALKPGEVLVLENTRFHPEEEANDLEMARQLASLADLFVNDAFGTAHRAHASTEGVTHYLPGVAGFLLEREIQYLGQAVAEPNHPFVAILGGAKIKDKIGVIRNLLGKADTLLIGGGMANTFLKAQGYEMADSLVEDDALDTARELLELGGSRLMLPVDLVIADAFDANAERKVVPLGNVPAGWRVLDIGPETVKAYGKVLSGAGTVVWNGPMGVFEYARFAEGTFGIAKAVAESGAVSIIGGGESVQAVQQSGLADKITHISTGGGASLEMLEGLVLPGVAALQDR